MFVPRAGRQNILLLVISSKQYCGGILYVVRCKYLMEHKKGDYGFREDESFCFGFESI